MSSVIKIIQLSYVDESGNITIFHPETDISSVNGLQEALQEFNKTNPLPIAGGTMQGDINMDGHSVLNLPEPKKNGDPVTKGFMENYINETFLGGVW